MSMPVVQDITIKQGTTFELEIEVLDSGGDPEDLTGYTGQMQIRATDSPDDDTILATANVSINAGVVLAVIGPSETEDAEWVCGVYDLIITNGSRVLPIAEGTARLTRRITR